MIAIVKYNAGNNRSVENALKRLGCESVTTDDSEVLRTAEKVIFPGVGEASTAMEYLKEKGLDKVLTELTQPVMGICLGLQLLCKNTEEGSTKCLGIFDAEVKRFPELDLVPQIGWNNFELIDNPIFEGVSTIDDVYFVHSYYSELCDETVASSNYIIPFSAALNKDNFYACQFHPEKSGPVGEQILKNFLEL